MFTKLNGMLLASALVLSLLVTSPAMAFPPIGMRYTFYSNSTYTVAVGSYTYCPSISYKWGYSTSYRKVDCNPMCPLEEAQYCSDLI